MSQNRRYRGIVQLAAFVLCVLLTGLASAQLTSENPWVAAWTAAPDSAGPALKPQTIRQIIRSGIDGSTVRVRLSNLFGTGALVIGSAHVALHTTGAAIQQGSDHTLQFDGKPGVSIAKGESALSDPLPMAVAAQQELAISLYLPDGASASTIHSLGLQTAYSLPGQDVTGALTFAGSEVRPRYFLTEVDVSGGMATEAVVAFGDSITDGVGSTPGGNDRWPDRLTARLRANPETASIAVLNAGIVGNRILHGASDPFIGPGGLDRFERDALDKPGVRWVVLLQGIGDIAGASMLAAPENKVSAEQIIAGMQTMIARAHEKNIRILGTTLLPFKGAGYPFYTAAGEKKRQQVNRWIRSSGAFDAVVDFDQSVRDPKHPDRLQKTFDSGDHLHPNPTGYQAMADAINPALFSAASKVGMQ